MKRCKSCDFFDGKPGESWGDCDNEKIFHDGSDFMNETPPSALFEYHDSEGYGGSFEVHKNFGCVGHKSRRIRRLFSRSRTKGKAQTPYLDQLETVEPSAEDLANIKGAQAMLKDWSKKNVAEAKKIEQEQAAKKESSKKT